MEVITKTEYQDIYRVKEGVLLVVNKFEYMFGNDTVSIYPNGERRKKYEKDTKNLTICKRDMIDYKHNDVKEGTVLYCHRPVINTEDTSKWRYEIKTTGDSLSGSHEDIIGMLNDIKNVLNIKE